MDYFRFSQDHEAFPTMVNQHSTLSVLYIVLNCRKLEVSIRISYETTNSYTVQQNLKKMQSIE